MKDDELEGKKVVIGLSGGMDSAVTAYLLKKQGMKVIGVHFLSMPVEYLENIDKEQEQEIQFIKKFCEFLGIPFYNVDISKEFEESIISRFIARRIAGLKDISLYYYNKILISRLEEMRIELDAQYISTGHFAKINFNHKTSEYAVHANNDTLSDQSSSLGFVDKKVLENLLLPLGDLKISDIQKLSENFSFKLNPRSSKAYSFASSSVKAKILQDSIPSSLLRSGSLINIETEHIYGQFESQVFYEVGEKNLRLGNTSLDKNLEILIYDEKLGHFYIGPKSYLSFKAFQVLKVNWAKGNYKNFPLECNIRIGEEKKLLNAKVYFKNNQTCYLELEEEIYPILKGEVVSFFEKSLRSARLLGIGEIGERGALRPLDRVEAFKNEEESDVKERNLPFDFNF